jgi:hypothetical protein
VVVVGVGVVVVVGVGVAVLGKEENDDVVRSDQMEAAGSPGTRAHR